MKSRQCIVVFAGLFAASFQVHADVIASVSKSEADGFGQHIPGSEFPNTNDGIRVTNSGGAFATASGSFSSETQTASAFAGGAYEFTEGRGFIHPSIRLEARNRGNIGNRFGGVSANVRIEDRITVIPKDDPGVFTEIAESLSDTDIVTFRIDLFDNGQLFSPPLRRFFHGGHGVEYSRVFNLSAVRERGSNSRLGFLNPFNGGIFNASVGPGDDLLRVTNRESIRYDFIDLPFLGGDRTLTDGLDFDFVYEASLETSHIAFGLDPETEAFGEFRNTAGFEGLRLITGNGEDITRLFNFTNSNGDALFVPEPTSLTVLGLMGVMLASRRRRTSVV